MICQSWAEMFPDELFLAGETVPSGVYKDVETGRQIELDREGILPASLDGRVAAYVCLEYTWLMRPIALQSQT